MFKLESDVNDYVKSSLVSLGLKKLIDFNEESGMSEYMKEALRGSAKTKRKLILVSQIFILKNIMSDYYRK
jgi:hypothetical protein